MSLIIVFSGSVCILKENVGVCLGIFFFFFPYLNNLVRVISIAHPPSGFCLNDLGF